MKVQGMRMKGKAKYSESMPRQLYSFFTSSADSGTLPSFERFARSIGVTLEDITAFRKHREFDRSYRECSEIRRDYLIDAALTRRFDPSFSKFILGAEYGMGEKERSSEDGEIDVTLRVISEDKIEA